MVLEWIQQQQQAISTFEQLSSSLVLTNNERESFSNASRRFNFQLTPHLLELIQKHLSIRKQFIPQSPEHTLPHEKFDPLDEDLTNPVALITHRHPNRVLFYTSTICSAYCRYCTRARKVGSGSIKKEDLDQGINYIKSHSEISDILISGGEFLLNSDGRIKNILLELANIPHIQFLRIGSRLLLSNPYRFTSELIDILKQANQIKPITIMTHFNVSEEITQIAAQKCFELNQSGIMMRNQSVLLKGINDDVLVLNDLNQKLMKNYIHPYYLLMCDPVEGSSSYRTEIENSRKLLTELIKIGDGLTVPHLVDDLGIYGKVRLASLN